MNGTEYQKLAMRTNDRKGTERLCQQIDYAPVFKNDVGGIINACLGLSGEVGELNDMIKKWIFHEKQFDVEHAKKEVGDILWYIAMMCESFSWDMSEMMEMNIEKLKARYPKGFDVNLANHRKEGDV